MKIRVQTSLEHGILFLFDPYGKTEIPSDTGLEKITFTSNCVAFHTLHYVDGEADIVISDIPFGNSDRCDYSGRITCESQKISLTDTSGNNMSILSLDDDSADIEIWYYGNLSVWIQIKNLSIF
jgi:hypothetical protein